MTITLKGGSSTQILFSDMIGAPSTPASGAIIYSNSGVVKLLNSGGTPSIVQTLTATRPNFKANVSSTVTNVTGNNVHYQIIFDQVLFDQASNYNNSTGKFTAPVTGIYQFNASVEFSNIVLQTGVLLRYVVNNVEYTAYVSGTVNLYTGGVVSLSQSQQLSLTAGDTVGIKVQATGSTQTVSIDGDGTNPATHFGGYLIG